MTIHPDGKELTAGTPLSRRTWHLKPLYDFIMARDGHGLSKQLRGFQEACQDSESSSAPW